MEKILVFAGKGGVGKTTCAATTALHYALCGKRTLIISTDPTPSLADIFDFDGEDKMPVKIIDNLNMQEIGISEIKHMWETKFGREVYEVFSSFVSIEYPDFVEFMTSVLPGLGDEFMLDYIRRLSKTDDFEVIVWDTAPLGQTLALLETPSLLRRHLRMAPRIYSGLKIGTQSHKPVIEILKSWEKLSGENVDFLRNQVIFNTVAIAEALAVNQLRGVFQEMSQHGLKLGQLIVNNVVQADGSAFLASRSEQQKKYLKTIHEICSGIMVVEVPLFPGEIKGIDMLRKFEAYLFKSV
jgi:arsenite-transporting ATPase